MIAQRLRTLTVLPKDLGSSPRTPMKKDETRMNTNINVKSSQKTP